MAVIDHVQIAIPPDGEDAGRRFYGDLLGLAEIPKPAELGGRGGCWFEIGSQQIHLGVESDFRPARKAHVAIAVESLPQLRDSLADSGFEIHDDVPLGGRARFFTSDPFGNRVEIVERASREG